MERVALVLVSLSPFFAACSGIPCTNATALVRDGGGSFACIKSEDCPLLSYQYFCQTNGDPHPCVACETVNGARVCVLRAPATCGVTP